MKTTWKPEDKFLSIIQNDKLLNNIIDDNICDSLVIMRNHFRSHPFCEGWSDEEIKERLSEVAEILI